MRQIMFCCDSYLELAPNFIIQTDANSLVWSFYNLNENLLLEVYNLGETKIHKRSNGGFVYKQSNTLMSENLEYLKDFPSAHCFHPVYFDPNIKQYVYIKNDPFIEVDPNLMYSVQNNIPLAEHFTTLFKHDAVYSFDSITIPGGFRFCDFTATTLIEKTNSTPLKPVIVEGESLGVLTMNQGNVVSKHGAKIFSL